MPKAEKIASLSLCLAFVSGNVTADHCKTGSNTCLSSSLRTSVKRIRGWNDGVYFRVEVIQLLLLSFLVDSSSFQNFEPF